MQFACFYSQIQIWHFTFQIQASIHKFLEKTKKRKISKPGEEEVDVPLKLTLEQERLRKRVNDLLKKQRLSAARHIVKYQDDSKSWGQEIRAKVCLIFMYSRVELLSFFTIF